MRALRRYTLLGAPVLVVLASVAVLGPSPTSSATAVTTTARATIAHTAAPHVVAAHAATPHTVTPSASPGPYSPLNPVRICDTRAGNPSGLSGTADQCDAKTIAQGGTLSIDVAGSFGVPADATAAVLNVTAVHPVGQGYLTLYPAGSALPTASSLNVSAGAVVANLVEVRLGTGGQVSIFASTSTDVVIDLEGYVDTTSAGGAGAGLYNPLPTPARICDTRSDSGLTGPAAQCTGDTLSAGGSLNVQVSGVGGVPASGVSAVVLNVTATNEASAGYLTVYPQGSARPTASNLNYVASRTVPNRVIVPVSASGMISIFSLSQSDVVVDVSGWFSAAGGTGDQFVPTSVPTRICDTRSGSGLTGPAAQCTGRTLGPGATLSIQVSGLAGVPTGASAVVANVTAVSPSTQTYLTVFPSGTPPVVSDLNPGAGKVEPNLVVATLSSGGGLEIFNHAGSVNVVVDVVGWYQPVPPTVSGVTPDTGAATGATPVTITGTNLTGASAVDFGSVSATFSVASPTEISATSPAGTGTVDVTVTTAGGTSATSAADQFSYRALPRVTSVSPSAGPTTGGTVVTITGADLTGASAVDFGATAALSYEVDSDSQISATSPAGTGTVDVTVTGVNGPSATGPADDFTYDAVPIVTSVSPVSGSTAGGTSVTITGTHLTGATAVDFGTTPATTFTVNSSAQITATTPAGTGTLDVTVTTPGGTSATTSTDRFTYVLAPSVTSVSPTAGPLGGTGVTITGINLTAATTVHFGATPAATFTVNSAMQIIATAPAGTGIVDVTVTTPGGTSATTAADHFTYDPVPVVTLLSPASGSTAGGTSVTITGTNLTGATAVEFGATPATTFTVNSATQITATAPAGSDTVDVTVTTPGGTSPTSSADRFSFLSSSPPVVSTINPTSGPAGTIVTITGTGFTGASAVDFGSTPATTFVVDSDTQVTATAPVTSGTVDVTVTAPAGTSATTSSDRFTYSGAHTPVVSSVSPTSGPSTGGSVVTITGSGLSAASAVTFGTVAATSFMVNTDSQIGAVAPAGTGTVDVTVTTPGGTSATSSSDRFTYEAETGCTDVWTGTASSSWSTGTNWSTGAVPGTSDTVCIPAGVANLPVDLGSSATVSTITNAGGLDLTGTLDLTGASSTSSGPLNINDGSFGGSGAITVTGALNLSNYGSLSGPGTTTVAPGGSLTVGATGCTSLCGYTYVSGGSLVNHGTGVIEAGWVLRVRQGATFDNAGPLGLNDYSGLDADTGTASSASESGTTPAIPAGVINNSGTITVTSATAYPASLADYGSYSEDSGINDTGTIDIVSGQLEFGGLPSQMDTIDTSTSLSSPSVVDAGATVDVAAGAVLDVVGNVDFDSGSSFDVSGTVDVTDGALSLDMNTTIPTLNINDGSFGGSGAITVTGALNLSNYGSLSGPGTTTVAPGGSLTVGATGCTSLCGYTYVSGGSLVNHGTGVIEAGWVLRVRQGATFDNAGPLGLNDYSGLDADTGTASSASESGTTPAIPAGVINNSGTITVTSATAYPASLADYGSYSEDSGINDTGTIDIVSGQLEFGGLPSQMDTIDTSTSLSSPSVVDAGATVDVAAGAVLDVVGNVDFDSGSSFDVSGTVDVTDGALSLDMNTTIPTLNINDGSFGGSGAITVTGALNLSNYGSLSGPGTTTVAPGGSLTVGATGCTSLCGYTYVSGGSLVNHGTGVIEAGWVLRVRQGATFDNAGSLGLNDYSGLDADTGTASSASESGTTPAIPAGVINNSGTITVTSATAYPASLADYGSYSEDSGINDTGTIDIVSGQLEFGGLPSQMDTIDTSTSLSSPSVVDAGATVDVAAGAVLDVVGNVDFDSGSSFDVSGTVDVTDGALSLDMNTTIPTLNINDGSFGGSGAITVTGALNLSNYGSLSGPGTTTVAPGGSLTVGATGCTSLCGYTYVSGGSLVNHGTGVIEAGWVLRVRQGATFDNAGPLGLNDYSGLDADTGTASSASESGTTPAIPAGVINNSGTITVTSATAYPASLADYGSYSEDSGINDTGTIDIVSGQLEFGGLPSQMDTIDTSTSLSSPSVVDAGATVDVAAGAVLDVVGNVDFDSGSSFDVSGTVDVTDGALSLDMNTTIPTLNINDGSFGGSGAITVTGALNLSNYGSLSGPGTTTVAPGGSLTVGATGCTSLCGYTYVSGGSLVNHGTGVIEAGWVLRVRQGATFDNAGSLGLNDYSGLDADTGTASSASESGTTPAIPAGVINNSGTITVTSATAYPASLADYGSYSEDSGINDTGTIDIVSGQLEFGGLPSQMDTIDTSTSLSSPSVVDAGATVDVAAGAVLDVVGNVDFDSGSSFDVSGTVDVTDGALSLDMNTTIPTLNINDGSLELGRGIVSTATNLTLSGELQLDTNGSTFGQLRSESPVSLGSSSLYLASGNSAPVCGTAVTALTAPSVSGAWDGVSGPTPSGGTWEATSTSTTAGAYVYCPPPPESVSETYGDGSSYDFANASGYQAEPVNTGTGAYSTTERDAQLSSIGVPFSFIRSYTSSDTASGPLGVGWTDSMNVTATASGTGSGSTVTIADENGQQVTYTESASGTYSGPPGTRSTLAALGGGGWTLTRQNQDTLTFNAIGDLVSEVDRNGVGLTLTYNGSNRLASVTDYAGHTVTFTYNTAGLLASMSFPPSRTVTYTYNPSNQLISVTDAAGKVTSYTYSSAGLLATVTDQNGHQEVANTYNSSGQVISQTNADAGTATFSYDSADDTTTYTDPAGHQWQDVYQNGVLVERIDPTGGVTSFAYDSNLDLSAVTDPDGDTTTMTYDAAGNMTSKTSPLGITQSWTYDAMNDVTSYIDGKGNETTWSYNVQGDKTQMVLPGGATTTYTPDAQGLDTSITDPNGHSTTDAYNAAGQLTSVATPLGDTTTYTYDAAGRRLTMVDARGNATGATPAAHTTTYGYDAMDDLTSVTNPDGDTTTSTYDGVGNKTSVTDALGHTTTYGYDGADHLTTVTAPGGATTTTTYTYDANGNKASVTDALGHTTTYTYDADNRLTEVTDALGHTTTYGYDPDGRRTSVTDPDAAATTYTYDQDGRLTQISYSDSTPTVTYGYDRDDNRVSMTDGTGTTSYTYNDRNERTAVSGPEGTFTYTYDPDGNVTSRTYPDATVITYTYTEDDKVATMAVGSATTTFSYDPDDELTTVAQPNSVTETVTYDAAGQVASVTDTKAASPITSYSYSYDAAGNPTTVVADGQSDTYTYDNRNRLTSACYAASCASGQITYSYDADANRTAMTDAAGTTDYTYNAADELTATSGATSSTYSYNADGERTAAGSTTYAYNAAGELTSLTSGASTTAYAYNGAGDRVSATTGSSTTDYLYDPNSLVPTLALEETGSGTVLDRYTWADGLAISATVSGSTYYLAHDALGSVVGVTSASGTTEATTVYDPYGNVHSSTTISGAPQIPLGFEAELLDPSGLYHLGARQMDPTTGTFLSQDPLSEPALAPAVSPYLYAGDQPTTLWDPTGMSSVTDRVGGGPSGGSSEEDSTDQCEANDLNFESSTESSEFGVAESGAQLASDEIPGPTDAIPGGGLFGLGHLVKDVVGFFGNLFSAADQAQSEASHLC